MRNERAQGIFCLEGEWDDALSHASTVQPLLHFLDQDPTLDCIHRDVGTVSELEHFAARWLEPRYDRYRVGYLAFHGDPGSIRIGTDSYTLDDLGRMLDGLARGRVIHFGACDVLDVDGDSIAMFLKRTGAVSVSGYAGEIDWYLSSALDLIVFDALTTYENPADAWHHLRATCSGLMDNLAFRMHWLEDGGALAPA